MDELIHPLSNGWTVTRRSPSPAARPLSQKHRLLLTADNRNAIASPHLLGGVSNGWTRPPYLLGQVA